MFQFWKNNHIVGQRNFLYGNFTILKCHKISKILPQRYVWVKKIYFFIISHPVFLSHGVSQTHMWRNFIFFPWEDQSGDLEVPSVRIQLMELNSWRTNLLCTSERGHSPTRCLECCPSKRQDRDNPEYKIDFVLLFIV